MPTTNPGRRGRGSIRVGAALALAVVVVLGAVAVGGEAPRAQSAATPDPAVVGGVNTLTGPVTVSNPLLFDALSEPYALLSDLTNFVARDVEGVPPDDPQVLGRIAGGLDRGTYVMPLPIVPAGAVSDVDRGAPGTGVQIYSVDLQTNYVGDPFFGPFETETGWQIANSSVRIENGTNEIVGGRAVVWAPDAGQLFPADFGPDGLLFTADDPLAPLAPGWTVVDLDQRPFALLRSPSVEVPILEGDAGLKDLSDLTYTAAFDALVAELRVRYPFTEFKGIDWDAVVAEIRPQVEQAERDGDGAAFNVAIWRFSLLLGDGQTSVQPPIDRILQRYGAGLGLTLGQTDGGAVIVRSVAEGLPAARAGIQTGAEIVSWGGAPVAAAIAAQELIFPASSPHTTVLQQLALLPRREAGATVNVGYRNPDGAEAAVDLLAVADEVGLFAAFGGGGADPAEPPVTVEVLDSGIGYVRVNAFLDDLTLIGHGWEWALNRLADLGVPALIVDVRGNGGGAGSLPPYFAGSFATAAFDLYEVFFADETGQLLSGGTSNVVPAPVQWAAPVAVLIDENCASACELFAAAMANDPAHLIVGQYPTAGVEAAIFPWNLPEDLYFQASLGLLQANGEVFIEGRGVPPTVDVPVTREGLTGDADVVLTAAEAALAPLIEGSAAMPGAGATPVAGGSLEATPVLVASPVTVPAP